MWDSRTKLARRYTAWIDESLVAIYRQCKLPCLVAPFPTTYFCAHNINRKTEDICKPKKKKKKKKKLAPQFHITRYRYKGYNITYERLAQIYGVHSYFLPMSNV